MHAGGISLLSAVSMDPRYTYLLINLGSILVPFIVLPKRFRTNTKIISPGTDGSF